MANRVRVTVKAVNDAVQPAIVTTDLGVFRLKRNMKKAQEQVVMKQLERHAYGGEQCFFVCVLQNKRSGGTHTLLAVQSL